MSVVKRVLILAASMAAMTSMASAYYYWIFFASHAGAFAGVPGRFDLTVVKDNTVNYFISDQGPAVLTPGDSPAAIYSQVQQAAGVWNSVGSSALRLHFGGIVTVGAEQSAPGIDVVFDDDMPPGLLAQTKPTFPENLNFLIPQGTGATAPAFVPILRSRVQLRSDLTAAGLQQSSYTDAFFLTLVHEFGHALGLQHTLTSGVMSTGITRATSKGAPLSADDIAGISLLYPAPGYGAFTGSITGAVTLGGAGVNLASVVALSTNGVVVSGMTNPDGTYRIDGIAPGQYYVYAHPLPPVQTGEGTPANIISPVDANHQNFASYTGFDTSFFPGTKDWTQATQVGVVAGKSIDKINFAVAARPGPAVHDMQTYGNLGGASVPTPPFLGETRNSLAFFAPGTTVNNQTAVAPGLNVSVIGNAARVETGSLRYYTQGYLLATISTGKVTSGTPTALAVTVNNDLYVLPAAFSVVPAMPPTISQVIPGVTKDGAPTATIAGTNLTAATRVLFDGAPASLLAINEDGSLLVSPPPAPSGHQAAVEATNPDGLTSLQSLGLSTRPVYTYALHDEASITVLPVSITGGTDGLIAVTGTNTHFVEGQSTVGVGTSDITVRRSWVVNPGFLVANITMNSGASVGSVNVTASTGLELLTAPAAIQVLGPVLGQMSLRVPILNALTGLAGVPAGGSALISASGLPRSLAGWSLLIGGLNAPYTVNDKGVIVAQVPSDVSLGPQAVQLVAPDGTGPQAILMQVDTAPPVILSAFDNTAANGTGAAINASAPARAADTITLTVSGLAGGPGAGTTMWINAGGNIIAPSSIGTDANGNALVQFALPAQLPYDPAVSNPTLPVMVGTGTRLSAAFILAIRVDPPPVATTN